MTPRQARSIQLLAGWGLLMVTWLAPVLARAAEDRARIVVIRQDRADPAVSEVATRAWAELTAAGLRADLVDCTDTRSCGGVSARPNERLATVATFRRDGQIVTEIEIGGAGTSPRMERIVAADASEGGGPRVVAILVVERVRAALLPERVKITAPAATAAATTAINDDELPAHLTQVRRGPKWSIGVGPTVVEGPGELGRGYGALARAEYFAFETVGIASVVGTARGADFQGTEGAVALQQSFAMLELVRRFLPEARLRPHLSLGAGACHVAADFAPNHSDSLWSLLLAPGVGAELSIASGVSLLADARAVRKPAARRRHPGERLGDRRQPVVSVLARHRQGVLNASQEITMSSSSSFKLGIALAMLLFNGCSVQVLAPPNAGAQDVDGGGFDPTGGGPGGAGGGLGGSSASAPRLGSAPLIAPDPPPPISGGTLLMLRDGRTAVASDPDRDRIFVADIELETKIAEVALEQHDEPGRLVEDAAGRVHVALRRGGAIVTIDPIAGTILSRRSVCALPRGVAYDAAADLLHVACMGGELVSLPAAGGLPIRTLRLSRDLRDVVVDGDTLLVSRFRRADVLVIDASGRVVDTIAAAAYTNMENRAGAVFIPGTAWRMRPGPDGGAMVLHQRDATDTVPTHGRSYGNNGCNSVVHPSVTTVVRGQAAAATPALSGMVLAVDFSLSSTGTRIAVVAAGNAHNGLPVLYSTYVAELANGSRMNCSGTGVVAAPRALEAPRNATQLQPQGEAVAVAYDGRDRIVIQTREPATLQLPETGLRIELSLTSRTDSGHLIFHANAGSGIACASCHAEGLDDGHVWNFDGLGPRRTMSLEGGIVGRAPYHWTGELANFSALAASIYVGRMSGPELQRDFVEATLRWIDTIPRLPSSSMDEAAVTRGRALFEDPSRLACSSCHAGPNMTTGALANVGTGGTFKVPSLTGLAWRPPYLHNGCAATLTDRFGPCGGGDAHGATSTLSPSQIADLVAYLETL